jgi:hypothetical protein
MPPRLQIPGGQLHAHRRRKLPIMADVACTCFALLCPSTLRRHRYYCYICPSVWLS